MDEKLIDSIVCTALHCNNMSVTSENLKIKNGG